MVKIIRRPEGASAQLRKNETTPEGVAHTLPGGQLTSTEGILRLTDVLGQVGTQLLVLTRRLVQLAHDVRQDFTVSQLSQNLLVPIANGVAVVWMRCNMILILALPSTCYFPWFS